MNVNSTSIACNYHHGAHPVIPMYVQLRTIHLYNFERKHYRTKHVGTNHNQYASTNIGVAMVIASWPSQSKDTEEEEIGYPGM